jgi:hypothetical protein
MTCSGPIPADRSQLNAQENETMKSLRFMLSVVLMSLSTVAFAQSHAQESVALVPSDAQKSFDKLKSLAGTWEGPVTSEPQMGPDDGKPIHVSFRVTSMGNALMHETTSSGSPYDPITMLYLEGDRLFLTHYCDAGNRPRMTGKMSPDGKTVEFEFLDVANLSNTQYGHMHHAVFTFIDANHHTEDWTFMVGEKPVHAHFDLHRTN